MRTAGAARGRACVSGSRNVIRDRERSDVCPIICNSRNTAFILFYNSIKEMIHETLNKTYGDDWMFNM